MLKREEREFDELFYEALKDKGLGIPILPQDVARASELEVDFDDLPTRLQDAADVLRRRRQFVLRLNKLVPEEDDCDELNVARAARFGSDIPSSVEEKMRKDRDEAERGKQ